jgi:hypothetical protein
MHVPAPPRSFLEGPPHPILHTTTTTPSDVPVAVDVPSDGAQHVPQPMEWPSKQPNPERRVGKSVQKLKQTRRGRGDRNRKREKIQIRQFSILGTNSNGLKAKKTSLVNTVNHFNNPSVITVQETKLRHYGIIKLNGYQIFEMHRAGLGGGLLTAVRHELEPVLVNQCDKAEIMVVQVKVGSKNIRIFNAYGPQETEVSP